jgi:hypothetical protein
VPGRRARLQALQLRGAARGSSKKVPPST